VGSEIMLASMRFCRHRRPDMDFMFTNNLMVSDDSIQADVALRYTSLIGNFGSGGF
jgi:hypothetical protein